MAGERGPRTVGEDFRKFVRAVAGRRKGGVRERRARAVDL